MNWSEFWSAASALSATGVLIFTAFYVRLTYRLAKAAEHQIWVSSRAQMSVSITTNQGGQLFLLAFENIGASPAENVRVRIDKPLHQQLGHNNSFSDFPFIKEGVRSLPPRHPIKFALGVSFRWLEESADRSIHPVSFNVLVNYETQGRFIEEVFPIDIERQFSLSARDKNYLDEFGRNFPDKFERSMGDVSRALNKIVQPQRKISFYRKSWARWFAHEFWQSSRWR